MNRLNFWTSKSFKIFFVRTVNNFVGTVGSGTYYFAAGNLAVALDQKLVVVARPDDVVEDSAVGKRFAASEGYAAHSVLDMPLVRHRTGHGLDFAVGRHSEADEVRAEGGAVADRRFAMDTRSAEGERYAVGMHSAEGMRWDPELLADTRYAVGIEFGERYAVDMHLVLDTGL